MRVKEGVRVGGGVSGRGGVGGGGVVVVVGRWWWVGGEVVERMRGRGGWRRGWRGVAEGSGAARGVVVAERVVVVVRTWRWRRTVEGGRRVWW